MLDEAGPQVAFNVVPSVEVDLHDLLPEWERFLRSFERLPAPHELGDAMLHRLHEVRLARAPVAEEPYGQWWLEASGGEQIGESIDLGANIDQVVASGDSVCLVLGNLDGFGWNG